MEADSMMLDMLKYLIESRWSYIAIAVPLFLFGLLFYLKNKQSISEAFYKFVLWARPSLEAGGKASPEKIAAFVVINFVYVPGRLIFVIKNNDPLHLLYGSAIDATLALLLFRIITPGQILELKGNIAHKPERKPDDSQPS